MFPSSISRDTCIESSTHHGSPGLIAGARAKAGAGTPTASVASPSSLMPFVRQQHTDGRITDYIPQWNHFIDRSWGTHDILRPHDVLPCCTSSRGSPEPQRFISTGKMLYRSRVSDHDTKSRGVPASSILHHPVCQTTRPPKHGTAVSSSAPELSDNDMRLLS